MARRIKEEPIVHQNRIADKAGELFSQKGVDNTSMDEIAKAAGYSKATLYVYFNNKEDIVAFLTLKGMEKLKDVLISKVDKHMPSKETFFDICYALVDYQRDYPDFFDMLLKYIEIDTNEEENSLLNQIYVVGEEINVVIAKYMEQGVKKGELNITDNYLETTFHLWGMVSGLVKMADEKKDYLEGIGNISKKQFLDDGFEKLYRIIEKNREL